MRYLTLKDHRYGVDIEVPCKSDVDGESRRFADADRSSAASILSLFGFRTTAYWWPECVASADNRVSQAAADAALPSYAILIMMFGGLTVLSCLALIVLVRERR